MTQGHKLLVVKAPEPGKPDEPITDGCVCEWDQVASDLIPSLSPLPTESGKVATEVLAGDESRQTRAPHQTTDIVNKWAARMTRPGDQKIENRAEGDRQPNKDGD